jgi:hypothetical protein
MSDEPFEPEDALEFHGVEIPLTQEEHKHAQREMAECFIEEYMRMGYSPEFILMLCRNPFYQGLHAIWKSQGEALIREIINQTVRQWCPTACDKEGTDASGV